MRESVVRKVAFDNEMFIWHLLCKCNINLTDKFNVVLESVGFMGLSHLSKQSMNESKKFQINPFFSPKFLVIACIFLVWQPTTFPRRLSLKIEKMASYAITQVCIYVGNFTSFESGTVPSSLCSTCWFHVCFKKKTSNI